MNIFKYIIKTLIVVYIFSITNNLFAQEKKKQKTDTLYIEDYSRKLTVFTYGKTKYVKVFFRNKTNNKEIGFSPNNNFNIGFGFTYKWLGLGIAFNLPFDIKQITLQKLRNYGLINSDNEVFCESFQHYLLEQKGLSDYHKIWNKTEKSLKHLSKTVFKNKYGKDWESELKNKYETNERIKKIIKDASFYKQMESYNFNQPKNTTFIDTISTSGLLSIILEEWIFFQDVFGKSKTYWKEVFKPIINIRNVIQHNREEVAEELEIKEVNIQCEKIVKLVNTYLKNIV